MNEFKIGDIVTQNDDFYKYWRCETFHREISDIEFNKKQQQSIIYLTENVNMIALIDNREMNTNCFHRDYIKVDISEMRKNKLKNLDRV